MRPPELTAGGAPAVARVHVGSRLLRGLITAFGVGLAAAAISLVPAIFIQSVFLGEAQQCAEIERTGQAVADEVRLTCDQTLATAPFWLPAAITVTGGALGAAGGLVYGLFSGGRRRGPEKKWLPF